MMGPMGMDPMMMGGMPMDMMGPMGMDPMMMGMDPMMMDPMMMGPMGMDPMMMGEWTNGYDGMGMDPMMMGYGYGPNDDGRNGMDDDGTYG